ncbi:MAG: carbohydrate ABC transporter permease [Faecalibacterium sp.]
MFEKRSCTFDKIFDIVVFIFLVFIFFLSCYPLYFVLIASISNPFSVMRGEVILFPVEISFETYVDVLKDPDILLGYKNTFIYTFAGTVISVLITVSAAFALSRKDLYGHKFWMAFFLITMYFNGGLIPTYLQVSNLGLINTRWAIILVGSLSVWNLIICKTFFENTIPHDLWEASSIDGANMFQYFFKVVLPNAKAITAIMVLYYAVAQWNDFFKSLIYLSNANLYSLQMILRDLLLASQVVLPDVDAEALMQMMYKAESIKYVVIVVASLPVLCMYPFVQKYFVKGVMVGSVKG